MIDDDDDDDLYEEEVERFLDPERTAARRADFERRRDERLREKIFRKARGREAARRETVFTFRLSDGQTNGTEQIRALETGYGDRQNFFNELKERVITELGEQVNRSQIILVQNERNRICYRVDLIYYVLDQLKDWNERARNPITDPFRNILYTANVGESYEDYANRCIDDLLAIPRFDVPDFEIPELVRADGRKGRKRRKSIKHDGKKSRRRRSGNKSVKKSHRRKRISRKSVKKTKSRRRKRSGKKSVKKSYRKRSRK